jgi:predicted PurR-regulated permease PerM
MAKRAEQGEPMDAAAAGRTMLASAQGLPDRLASLQGERLYRFAGLLFLLAIVFTYFDAISRVMLIAFVGAIIAVAFNEVVKRLPLSRGLAVLLLVLVTLGLLAVTVWLGISALLVQFRQLVDDFPAIVASAEDFVQNRTGLELDLLGPRTREFVAEIFGVSGGASVVAGAFGILEVLAIALLVFVGAFFLVHRPNEQLLDPFMRAIPRERRPAFRRMFRLLGERLSAWLWGTMLLMLFVGAAGILAFYLLGTPYPLLLGVLTGITNIIPIVGPWIGGMVAIAVTLFVDPGLALWVALAVLVIQEIESNIVRPLVMSSSARIHPFVTLLGLLLFSAIFGVLGAILALPLTLALGTMVQVLWVEETLQAGDDEIEPVVKT